MVMITEIGARQRVEVYNDYSWVPDEIWYEILSRLPLNYLFVYRLVCKSWSLIVSRITKNMAPPPLCGFLIRNGIGPITPQRKKNSRTTYICVTKNAALLEDKPFITSGFVKGLFSELWFDFGALGAFNSTTASSSSMRKPLSLVSHKGLLLLDYSDGTYEVHNPLTRQVFEVPMSELFKKHGAAFSQSETCGLIANLSGNELEECSFVIVRFCRRSRDVEIYYSVTKRWSIVPTRLGSRDVQRAGWALQNYVALYKSHYCRTLSIYYLTAANLGVAWILNLDSIIISDPKTMNFDFPLPETLSWGDTHNCYNARIWESEGNILLSYDDSTGLWIWKSDSTTDVDNWSWVPQLVIKTSDPLRDVGGSSGREEIVKMLKAGHQLRSIMFHPYEPVIYILVKPNIFTYHVGTDTLVKIIKDFDFDVSVHRNNAIYGYPFVPCITSFHD